MDVLPADLPMDVETPRRDRRHRPLVGDRQTGGVGIADVPRLAVRRQVRWKGPGRVPPQPPELALGPRRISPDPFPSRGGPILLYATHHSHSDLDWVADAEHPRVRAYAPNWSRLARTVVIPLARTVELLVKDLGADMVLM